MGSNARNVRKRANRHYEAGLILGDLRRQMRIPSSEGGAPIAVVEGRNDLATLDELGIRGIILTIGDGRPLPETAERMMAAAIESSSLDPTVILLMDWDRTGGRLQRKLNLLLDGSGVFVDNSIRAALITLLTPETRTIESIQGWPDLIRGMSQEDSEMVD